MRETTKTIEITLETVKDYISQYIADGLNSLVDIKKPMGRPSFLVFEQKKNKIIPCFRS